jgi:hypothetical protein
LISYINYVWQPKDVNDLVKNRHLFLVYLPNLWVYPCIFFLTHLFAFETTQLMNMSFTILIRLSQRCKGFLLLLLLFEPKIHSQERLFVFCLENGYLISATCINTPCLIWLHLLHFTSNYTFSTKSLFLISYHLCLIIASRGNEIVTPI